MLSLLFKCVWSAKLNDAGFSFCTLASGSWAVESLAVFQGSAELSVLSRSAHLPGCPSPGEEGIAGPSREPLLATITFQGDCIPAFFPSPDQGLSS